MTSERQQRAPDSSAGRNGNRPELDSREGDPRKRDQQDRRTAGRDDTDERPRDDPSRAPESGTP